MITKVAIIRGGEVYSLPSPNRHHNIFPILPPNSRDSHDIQGFVDDNGKFLTREEAYIIATESGQINRRPGGYDGPKLFSEDLW